MFTKSKPSTPETQASEAAKAETTAPPQPKTPAEPSQGASTPSIISTALHVTGNLNCASDIEIKGTVDGDVKARSVKLDQSGNVTGKIVADSVYINGTVKGQIMARKVALAGSAKVMGDILHENLSIETGAFLEGNCRRLKDSDLAEAAKGKKSEQPSPQRVAAPAE